MSKIISVSRRTDIPAFYGEWFMNRLKEGRVDYINPYGGQIHSVSLTPEDVDCFFFWSKNYEPFIGSLKVIEAKGYRFYFNFTITGLPKVFEDNLVDKDSALGSLKIISRMYSPNHINWRYDPIIISEYTDIAYHLQRFEELASALEGYVKRCFFSFVVLYAKVKRNMEIFNKERIGITEPVISEKVELANSLAEISENYGISMNSCCDDYLIHEKIKKAHCVDGDVINELFGTNKEYPLKPTRKGCGCAQSIDIGAYDTCPHGCIYCYANIKKEKAQTRYEIHDPEASMLIQRRTASD